MQPGEVEIANVALRAESSRSCPASRTRWRCSSTDAAASWCQIGGEASSTGSRLTVAVNAVG
jgi:hypothetical protein